MKFNAGKVTEAEALAEKCRKLGVRWKLFGDNPEKLLEELRECRRQQAAWKNDSTSADAKRRHSNYLLTRARQVLEEGDAEGSDRLVREAEQIKVKRGLSDLKPEQMRQQLARKPGANRKPSAVVHADGVQADGLQMADSRARAVRQADGVQPAAMPATGKQPGGAKRRDIRQVVADDETLELPEETAAPSAGGGPRGASGRGERAGGEGAADRAKAQELLQQAQALLEAGRTDEARAKVQQAEKLDVAFEVMVPRPSSCWR